VDDPGGIKVYDKDAPGLPGAMFTRFIEVIDLLLQPNEKPVGLLNE
jgi:hypothetical protein